MARVEGGSGVNINLHIERLVLDGVPVGPGQAARVQAVVEAELARLLAADGLGPSLTSGGAMPYAQGDAIQLANDSNPTYLGTQIAQAAYGGLSK